LRRATVPRIVVIAEAITEIVTAIARRPPP
jgi:hypothetical protein